MSCQSQQSREGRPIGRATHSRTICNRRKAYIPPMVPCLVVKLTNEMQVLLSRSSTASSPALCRDATKYWQNVASRSFRNRHVVNHLKLCMTIFGIYPTWYITKNPSQRYLQEGFAVLRTGIEPVRALLPTGF